MLVIKNVRIANGDPNPADPRPVDILVREGRIETVGENLVPPAGAEVWQFENAWASPGWLDVGAEICDPGHEHREDFESATRAAAAGGFTAVACLPNTRPALHSKSEILYVQNKTAGGAVNFHPIGAISQDCAGKDLAELFDMHTAGAVAFSDGTRPVQDAGLLLRAMQYAQAFGGLVLNQPYHKTIAAGGQMHEGIVSTQLGMKGIPALAEELMVQRDLSLLEYAGGRLHLHNISTAKSVALVRAAKQAGLPVTASVAVANLCFTDEKLADFESNWKLLPPLRAETDRQALLDGLADGTLDFICSNHAPQDTEAKNLEFPYAEFGMIGLETAFALSQTFVGKKLTINELVAKWAVRPRQILGLPVPLIAPGSRAELTIFDPDVEWTFSEKDIRSKSANTPLVGSSLRGRALGIVNGARNLLVEELNRS
ncbi:MAG: dihydroorotase [Saprospiraceae bacterium]